MSDSTHKQPQTKTCTKCGRELPRSEFHAQREKRDGLQSHCKTCRAEQKRAYRSANAERIAKTDRAYRSANRERRAEYNRAWAKANPEKRAQYQARRRAKYPERYRSAKRRRDRNNPEKVFAQNVVNHAVERGKLSHISTQVCQSCGKQAQEYHHPDYSRPLDVVPLCRVCHKEVHR